MPARRDASLFGCRLHRDHYEHEDNDEERNRGPRYESDASFETLLAKANDWDLVNATFTKISDRHNHWVDASVYSPVERVIMLVWHLTGIIGNGGFEYLFAGEIDGDPDYHIAAEACKEAGLVRSYEAFREAFSLFPGGVVPTRPGKTLAAVRPSKSVSSRCHQ